jgi:hypothetical protein
MTLLSFEVVRSSAVALYVGLALGEPEGHDSKRCPHGAGVGVPGLGRATPWRLLRTGCSLAAHWAWACALLCGCLVLLALLIPGGATIIGRAGPDGVVV